jgi:hypothetical protein
MKREPELLEPDTGSVPLLKRLGPGLITGAADDDPSGIATYSQAGATPQSWGRSSSRCA